MPRRLALIGVLAAAFAVLPAAAAADTAPTPGNTTTLLCTFDKGITSCNHRTVEISEGFCFLPGQIVYFVDVFRSSRTYQGNAILPGLNDAPITVDFGPVPLTDAGAQAWDDSIYALAVRPHARLLSSHFAETTRTEGTEIMLDDPSCP